MMRNKESDIQLLIALWSHVTYGKVSESLPFVPLIPPPSVPPAAPRRAVRGGARGGRWGEGGERLLIVDNAGQRFGWGIETQARRSPARTDVI